MGYTYFLTSTVLNWQKLFYKDKYARQVVESLSFMIHNDRIQLHAYVIMPNHIHLLLTVKNKKGLSNFLRDFHKYTAQQILKDMRFRNQELLKRF